VRGVFHWHGNVVRAFVIVSKKHTGKNRAMIVPVTYDLFACLSNVSVRARINICLQTFTLATCISTASLSEI
jgi:hypothetical protein